MDFFAVLVALDHYTAHFGVGLAINVLHRDPIRTHDDEGRNQDAVPEVEIFDIGFDSGVILIVQTPRAGCGIAVHSRLGNPIESVIGPVE